MERLKDGKEMERCWRKREIKIMVEDDEGRDGRMMVERSKNSRDDGRT